MTTRREKINRVKLNLRRGAYYGKGSRVSDFTIEKTGIASMIDRISLAEKKVRAITRNGYTFYEADKEVRDLAAKGVTSASTEYNPLFDLSNDGQITEDDVDGLIRYDKYFPTYVVKFDMVTPSNDYRFKVVSLKYVNVDGVGLEIEPATDYLYVDIANAGDHTMTTGLKMINDDAFKGEPTLITADILDGNDYIGKSAFQGCPKLESVKIPGSVKIVGDNAFNACPVLSSCTIGSGVKGIGTNAFTNCSKLKSLTIPGSVASISGNAFSNCTELSSLTIAATAGSAYVGATPFNGCPNVQYLECYGKIPFSKLPKGTKFVHVELGDAVTGSLVLSSCTNLTSCTIGTGISSLGNNALKGCSSLKSFNTKNAKSIGTNAFDGCSSLSSLTIGSSVSSVTNSSFSNCENIKVLVCNGAVNCSNLPTGTKFTSVSLGNKVTGEVSFPGCGSLTSCTIGTGVTGIAANGFTGCTSLSSFTVNSGVITIGNGAFNGCTTLTSCTLTGATKLTTIGDNAFKGTGIKSVNLPGKVTTVGKNAYDGCTSLATLTLTGATDLTTIDESAFNGCTGLLSVNIPNNVTTLGSNAFKGCTSLTAFTGGTGIATMGDGVFTNCSGIKSFTFNGKGTTSQMATGTAFTNITLGGKVTGSLSYPGCANLTSCTIGTGITSIAASGFTGCTKLSSFSIKAGVTTIGNAAFSGCSNLGTLNTTSATALTTIGDSAFRGNKFTSVTIPASVTSIGANAFANNSNLASVTVKATTPPSLGSGAFSSVSSTLKIYVPSASVNAYKAADGWSTYASKIYAS